MLSETRSTNTPGTGGAVGTPSRAGIALLTLLLRSALQEAADAELTADGASSGEAHEQLRERLAPLLEQRRADLDAELTRARTEAAAVVAAAHRRASERAAYESSPIAEISAWLEDSPLVETTSVGDAPTPGPSSSSGAPPSVVPSGAASAEALSRRAGVALLLLQLRAAQQAAADAEAAAVEAEAEAEVLGVVGPALTDDASPDLALTQRRLFLDARLGQARAEAAAVVADAHREAAMIVSAHSLPLPVHAEPVLEQPATRAVEPTPIVATLDGEAFARMFATVFATVLDERLSAAGSSVVARPIYEPAPPSAPVPVRQSFWAHARHLDVLLLSAAMVIMLVVLAAWLA